MIALLLALAVQADGAGLVEKLRSEKLEEREDAGRALQKLGRPALPALQRALGDADEEVGARVRRIIALIHLDGRLTPHLKELVPTAEARLSRDAPSAWTDVFLEALKLEEITDEDLAPLAGPALKGAKTPADVLAVLESINERSLRSALPELLERLTDPESGPPALKVILRLDPGASMDAEIPRLLGAAVPAIRLLGVESVRSIGGRRHAPALRRLLHDPDPEVRARAAGVLASVGGRSSAADLTESLRDPAPEVRAAAARSLGELEARDAIPALMPLLKDPEVQVRRDAVATLTGLKAREAGPEFLRLLDDPDGQVRAGALGALAWFRPPGSEAVFVARLRDPEPEVRRRSANALLGTRSPAALDAVAPLLADPEASVRMTAAYTLGTLRGEAVREDLVRLLDDPDPQVRGAAISQLCRMPGTAPLLLALIEDPDKGVQTGVVGAMGELRAKEAIPALLKILQGDQGDGLGAAEALKKIGADDALPELLPLLKHEKRYLREYAMTVISGMDRQRTLPLYLELLRSDDFTIHQPARDRLIDLRAREALPVLDDMLRKGDVETVDKAYYIMWLIDEKEVQNRLPALLRDPVAWKRTAALARVRDRALLPDVLPLLKDGDATVREWAARALVTWELREALPVLREILGNREHPSRAWAALTLADWKHAEAGPALRELLKEDGEDSDPELRTLCGFTLLELEGKTALPEVLAVFRVLDLDWTESLDRRTLDGEIRRAVFAEAIDSIRKALAPGSERREQAIACLQSLPTLPGDPVPPDLLDHPDHYVRMAALSRLVDAEAPGAAAEAAKRLDDPAGMVRGNAAEFLARLGARNQIPRIEALLDGDEAYPAFKAADALAALGAKQSLPRLAPLALQSNFWSCDAIDQALLRLWSDTASAAVAARLGERESRVRAGAAWMLGRLEARDRIPQLRRLCADPAAEVRAAAAGALGALGAVEAEPELAALLSDVYPEVRGEAARALGVAGIRSRLPELLRMMDDPGEHVAYRAREGLVRLGGPDVVAYFVKHMPEPTAMQSLRELRAAESAPLFEPLLRSEDPGVRQAAAGARVEWGHRDGAAIVAKDGATPRLLNRLRRPDLWKRLAETPYAGPRIGDDHAIWAAAATSAGLKLDLGLPPEPDPAAEGQLDRLDRLEKGISVLDALQNRRLGFVLEDGAIRILDPEEERTFWRAWVSGN